MHTVEPDVGGVPAGAGTARCLNPYGVARGTP
ncbi:hypothetical protein BOBR111200_18920 [Bordetella bronchialis]